MSSTQPSLNRFPFSSVLRVPWMVALGLAMNGCLVQSADSDEDLGAAVEPIAWSSFKPANFVPGQNITIPAGTAVVFDGTAADAIGKLTILGSFECAAGARTLEAKAILVAGPGAVFKCGTAAAPRAEQFKIHLSGQASFTHAEMMTGCQSMPADPYMMTDSGFQPFVVTCGGSVDLHGAAPTASFTRLNATAAPSATSITVPAVDCARWSASSSIAIASSSFDQNQAETRTINGCSTVNGTTTLTLSSALTYQHYGAAPSAYSAGATVLSLEERAEVALLNRPILFQGTEATDAASKAALQDKKAAHMMFMMTPGHVRIEGVEFDTVGRMGELGRYPAHWHKVGDHTGVDAYIKSSVFHNTFNRCVTIHETNGVTIQNNVCFSHYGHGFFLEEGNEVNNVFDGNLGFSSKVVPNGRQILTTDRTSDNVGRYAAPSTYWISNPSNTYKNNVAAGSDGSGFWFGLKDAAHKPDGLTAAPNATALGLFENNLAHSSRQGITVDGGPNGACANNAANNCDPLNANSANYDPDTADFKTAQTTWSPPTPATFKRLTAYKNREFGIWFNSIGNSVVKESIFADNQIAVAMVFDSVLRDSVIVAKTANFDPATEIAKTTRAAADKQFAATLVYDGPTFLDNVRLENFGSTLSYTDATGAHTYQPMLFSLTVAASDRSPAHRVRAISLGSPPPPVVADFTHSLGHPNKDNWAAGVVDMDGSLTGYAGYNIVPKEDISNVNGCVTDARFVNSYICPGRSGQVYLASAKLQFDLFRKDTATGTVQAQYLLPTAADPNHPDMVPGAPYVNHQFAFPLDRVNYDTYVVQIHAPQYQVATSTADQTKIDLSDLANPVSVQLNYGNDMETSPPLEIYQMFHNCKFLNTQNLTNVSITANDTDVVKARFTAHSAQAKGWATGTYGGASYVGQKYQSVQAYLQCYVPTSVLMTSPTVSRAGAWYYQNGDLVGTTNAKFEAHVKGSNLKLSVGAGMNRGYAKITIDNVTTQTIDLYASSWIAKDFILATGLANAEHSVVIEWTGQKNASSTGTYLVLKSLASY